MTATATATMTMSSGLTADNEDIGTLQSVEDGTDREDEEEDNESIGMMGWIAKKYLLALKTPDHPQLLVVTLDSMFVSAIMRSKETKRAVKLSGYPSKIVCAPTNSLQIVPLYPDMILIPNQHDVHALLLTFPS